MYYQNEALQLKRLGYCLKQFQADRLLKEEKKKPSNLTNSSNTQYSLYYSSVVTYPIFYVIYEHFIYIFVTSFLAKIDTLPHTHRSNEK